MYLDDSWFPKWIEEVRGCLFEPTEVLVYREANSRTAIIPTQRLLITSNNYAIESDLCLVVLPDEVCAALPMDNTVTFLPLIVDIAI